MIKNQYEIINLAKTMANGLNKARLNAKVQVIQSLLNDGLISKYEFEARASVFRDEYIAFTDSVIAP